MIPEERGGSLNCCPVRLGRGNYMEDQATSSPQSAFTRVRHDFFQTGGHCHHGPLTALQSHVSTQPKCSNRAPHTPFGQ